MKLKETTGTCPACAAKWSWSGRGWLVSDIHGRLQPGPTPVVKDGEPEPLGHCPVCHALVMAGKATVREERG